ncbi:lysylphosphatidylglycerol synthase transmembrane domain-containing protein [Massilia niabensis]|uniref:Lysylphosphatidylglycerol synthase transmembrane domain-containing protein n=1 Tax=Massilia niabensis TaxID=544910 RepID=A0ABW0L789_9BURK
MSDVAPPRKGGWMKHVFGIVVTLLCVALIASRVNGAELLDAIEHFYWPYLGLGIACLAAGYCLRVLRWSLMLRAAGALVHFRNCVAPFLGSIALNNVLPLRMGDLVRALVFPAAMGISRTTATSSLVMERLIDLMTLLCSLAIGLLAIRSAAIDPLLVQSAQTMAVLGGAALTLCFLFSGRLASWLRSLPQAQKGSGRLAAPLATGADLLQGFDAMSRPRVLSLTLLISMLVWVCESGLFYFVMLGCGVAASAPAALLVMAIATLSTLVPSSPGYVGPFHLAAFTAVALVGGTTAQAGSYAVLVHLALWGATTVAGALAVWSRPELFRAARRAPSAAMPLN